MRAIVTTHVLLLVLVASGMPGCASGGRPRGMPPEDGIIAAAVVVGSSLAHEMERDPGAWPVEVRPSRAIILPDGTLRAEVGSSLGIDDRPGRTRHLREVQLERLWTRFAELGLGSPDAGNFTGNPKLLVPGPEEVVQVLEFRRDGRDWMIVDRFTVPEDDQDDDRLEGQDPRIQSALRAIAALAWASDVPPDDTIRFPERYDFGPDPWARFREEGP